MRNTGSCSTRESAWVLERSPNVSYVLENKDEARRLEEQSQSPDYEISRELEGFLPGPRARVLDAGCGSGVAARLLAERDPRARITACDASPDRIESARGLAKGIENVSFGVEDLTKLSYASGSFDYVV